MLKKISYMTAGESHGKGLIGIIDGIPAGLQLTEEYIAVDLSRRMQGHGRGKRMQIEKDFAEIFSGVCGRVKSSDSPKPGMSGIKTL